MKSPSSVIGLSLVVLLTACGVRNYDKQNYHRLEQAIVCSTNCLIDASVEEASQKLALRSVRWDMGCVPQTGDQLRIYHFDGFCLKLRLTQGRHNAKTWHIATPPELQIDRLRDPETRMSNYWDNVAAMFRLAEATSRMVEGELAKATNK